MIIPNTSNLIKNPDARDTTYPLSYDNIQTDESLTIEYASVNGTEESPTTPTTGSHILIGNERVKKVCLGDTNIHRVYLGDIRLL